MTDRSYKIRDKEDKEDEYMYRAQEKILEIIMEKNGKKRESKEISHKIYDIVNDTLHKYYIPDFDYVNWTSEDIGIENKYFNAWIFTCSVIPFYQTLGDTIGYHNARWEMNIGERHAGPESANDMIYEYISLGGINDMSIVNWIASDDTILYMATLDVLSDEIITIDEFGTKLRKAYLDAVPKMEGRHPGAMTKRSLSNQEFITWDKLPYDPKATGSGSAMRSGCIGIFYPGRSNRKRLIALAVEASRITHNSATAILGSITSALFTAYALEKVPVNIWPHKLLKLLQSNKIDTYMQKSRPDEYHYYLRDKVLFYSQWEKYINKRFSGLKPLLDIKMFKHPVLRIKFFAENFSKGHLDFPGGEADDCVIMAYDALLESGPSLEKLIVYSMLHHGDSDTIGSIAMSWFGAIYNTLKNMELVLPLLEELEFFDILSKKMFLNHVQDKMLKTFYHDMYLHYARKLIHKFT